jgi:hypothetical protein
MKSEFRSYCTFNSRNHNVHSGRSLGSFITPCPSPFNHVCVHRRTITSAKPRTKTPDIIPTLPFLHLQVLLFTQQPLLPLIRQSLHLLIINRTLPLRAIPLRSLNLHLARPEYIRRPTTTNMRRRRALSSRKTTNSYKSALPLHNTPPSSPPISE